MSWLRLLVLCIAMIAMPFQAVVAASMPSCGAGYGDAGAAARQAGKAMHDAHAHGDHGGSHSPDPSADPAHQCATCGACHATALTGPAIAIVFHDLPTADPAEPSFAVATRTPRLPDRPPRF